MSRRAKQIVGGVLVVTALIALAVLVWKQPWKTPRDRISLQLFDRAVEVLATTENGRDFRTAISGWSELLEARPDDRDLLLNQAVTVLKWIANTNSVLASGSITDPERQRALAQELQDAYAEADRVLKKLAESPQADGASSSEQALLESGLLEARARVLPYPEDIELRKAAAEKLLDALEQTPGQPLLAARLFDLSQELQTDWPEVMPRTTDAAFEAWQAQPRNLFLLVRTGESLLARNDKRVLELVDASVELAQPLLSMLPSARQVQPDQLASVTRAALEADNWNEAQRPLRGWFNILRSSTAFRADRRLVDPDILALLNTSFLERWRQLLPEQSHGSPAQKVTATVTELDSAIPDYESSAEQPFQPLIAWYDYDVDIDFDVLAIHGNQLRITPWEAEKPSGEAIDLELPIEARGLCIADLWVADAPQRPHVTITTIQDGQETPLDSNRHDTLQEVIVWDKERVIIVTRGNEADAKHSVLDNVEGLKDLAGIQQMVPLDIDSDGDLDLAAITDSGLELLQNNGNRTFLDVTQFSILGPEGWQPSQLVACDFDRDLDIDLVACARSTPQWAVYENILHSQFRFRALDEQQWKTEQPLVDAAVAEIDGNSSWDWCAISEGALTAVLTRTTGPGLTTASSQFEHPVSAGGLQALAVADFNLDGLVDACVAGASGIQVYNGNGSSFETKAQSLLEGRAAQDMKVQDANYDGHLDILSLVENRLQWISVAPADENSEHYVEVRVRGIYDDNGGGRINHYAIGSVIELWSDGHYQARVIDSPVSHFGLPVPEADNLRIIFNNGLTQNVLHPKRDTLLEERQELRGSCPFVYGWNGERFELITDLLWNAPLGLQTERGKVLPDRRWENLLLPGELVQPRDGAIELRVTEELWEVAYFDHMALTAIDHPSEVEVWTNEKVGPPQIAEHRLHLASRPIRPIAAQDGHGRDVLERISQRDRVYVQAFDRQICQGLCEPHSLELAFDPAQLAGRSDLRLVITGWMYPTDTSLNIGIAQNPDRVAPEPPSLWAPNAQGEFVCVQPFMGFPGGKPKTIVVDLSEVFTGDDTRLRIAATQQIYWDEAYITADEPPAPLRSETLVLESAQLHYRGFSQLMPRASDQPHWYDYHQVSRAPKWPPLEGPYTRFGNVLRQMQADDDRIVVMTAGDEMVLRFELPSRELPSGWRRDYVLHSVGWDKDSDINTLEGQSSLPLPFAAMKSYPPPLEQADESERVWQLNADSLTERNQFQQFWDPRANK